MQLAAVITTVGGRGIGKSDESGIPSNKGRKRGRGEESPQKKSDREELQHGSVHVSLKDQRGVYNIPNSQTALRQSKESNYRVNDVWC